MMTQLWWDEGRGDQGWSNSENIAIFDFYVDNLLRFTRELSWHIRKF